MTVPLDDEIVNLLTELKERSRFVSPNDLVFCTLKGTPQNENNLVSRILKPVAAQLGMPWLAWHALRHTYATLADQSDVNILDRQAQMGHGDLRQTIRYTQRDIERRRQGIHAIMTQIMPPSAKKPHVLELNGTTEKGEAA